MKNFKMWIYHETEKPKVIDSSELKEYVDDGWADSPARFIKLDQFGIDKEKTDALDPEECAKAQQCLDSVEGVVRSLNGALNLDNMNKRELEIYAQDHFGVELDRRKKLKDLRAQVRSIIEAE